MALAIALGALAGIVGFLPLFAALRLARRSESTQVLTTGMYGLGGSCVSLLLVAIALILCAVVDRSMVVPFAVAEVVVLIVTTSAYVVYKNVLAKRKVR
jgi:hypothetical protein